MREIHPRVERVIFVWQNSKSKEVGHRMLNIEIVVRLSPINPEQRRQRLDAIFGSCEQDSQDPDDFLSWNREQRYHRRPGFGQEFTK